MFDPLAATIAKYVNVNLSKTILIISIFYENLFIVMKIKEYRNLFLLHPQILLTEQLKFCFRPFLHSMRENYPFLKQGQRSRSGRVSPFSGMATLNMHPES